MDSSKVNKKHKKFYYNTTLLYIMKISIYCFSFIVFPYLTRIFGPEKIGLIGYFTSIGLFLQIVVDFGFSISATALVARANNDVEKINLIYSSITYIKILLLAIVFFCVSISGIYIKTFKDNYEIALFLITAMMLDALIPDFVYRGLERMAGITLRVVIIKVITVIFVFTIIKKENDLLAYSLILFIGSISSVLIGYIDIYRRFGIRIKKTKITDNVKIFKYSSKFFLSRIASISMSTLLIVSMKKNNSAASIGYYSSSEKLLNGGQSLLSPIADSIYPYLIKNKDYKLVKKILFILMPIIILFCTLVAIFSTQFVTLLFGKKFKASGPVLAWMMPAAILTLPDYIFGFPLLATIHKEKHANYSIILSSLVALVLILSLFFTKNLTPVTSAIILSCSTLIDLIYRMSTFFVHYRKINKREEEKK